MPPVEAGILKYILRHKDKGGREDLEKAQHLLNWLIDMEYGDEDSN